MNLEILTVGEILIDLTQTGVDSRGVPQFAANPGGAPANVAVAAARLGAKAGFAGRVGQDAFGAQLEQVLRDNGVDTTGLSKDPMVPTTLAVVSVDKSGERSFSFYRSPGADVMLCRTDILGELLENTAILHYGSVSLTCEPASITTLEAARYAKAHGAILTYDPNYRPSLWESEEIAKFWMRKGLQGADVVKISDEETALLTDDATPEGAAARLIAGGAKLVVVTLGAEGVYYQLGAKAGRVPGFAAKVADTNGAGDTFFGALLQQIAARGGLDGLEAPELVEMLRFANAAASVTISRPGAIPAMPTLDQVKERLEKE